MNKLIVKLIAKVMIARGIRLWDVAKEHYALKKRIADDVEMHREAREW